MQAYMINMALSLLTKVVTEEMVRDILRTLLDAIEKVVQSSENDLDDTIIIPLLAVVRSALGLTTETQK